MSKFLLEILDGVPSDLFTETTVKGVIGGSPDRRYGRVKRAIRKGELIHVTRGLYALSKKYQRKGINLYEAAQKIYGPSYVSFESALSYHGWIPEAVYTVTSASARRSKEVRTPLGLFSYTHIPSSTFFAGVNRIESPDGVFLMATPWRALCDYVYAHKREWASLRPVVESLRVDEKYFEKVDFKLLEELRESSRSRRVRKFIDHVKKELMS